MPQNQTMSSTATLFGGLIGASLLQVSYMYQKIGWCLAIIVQLLTIISVCFFYYNIIPAIHYTQSKSYREVTQKVLSNKLGMTLDIFNYINTVGIIAAYVVIGSNGITQFLRNICKLSIKRTWIVKIILGLIEFPLTMLKRLTMLGKIASYSTIAIMITAFTIWVYFFIGLKKKSLCGDIKYGISPFGHDSPGQTTLNFFMYIPVFQTMYIMHNSLAPLYQELVGPKIMRVKILRSATYIVIGLASFIYLVTGYTGSITFNTSISDNIINTYSDNCDFVWPNILFIVYSFVVIIAFPLILFPIKQSLMEVMKKQIGNKQTLASVLISVIYIVLSVGIGCATEKIISIFGIFTSFTGIVIVFGVPLGLFSQIPRLMEQYKHIDQEEANDVITDPVLVAALSLMHPSLDAETVNSVRRVSMALFNSEKDDTQNKKQNSVSLIYPRRISISVEQETQQINVRQSSVTKQQYRSSISSKQFEISADDGDDLIVQSNKSEQQIDTQQRQENIQPALSTKLQQQQIEEQIEMSDSVEQKDEVEIIKEQEQEYTPSKEVKKAVKIRTVIAWTLETILTAISLESLYMNVLDVVNSFKQ